VDDPDPAAAWLLDSPTPNLVLSPAAGVVLSPVASSGLGLQQPTKALQAMRASLEAEASKASAVDLCKEATSVVSLVRGKRTKVLTTETIRMAPASTTRVGKSSRLRGPAASTTSLEKAKRLAVERNLDSLAGTDDFSVLDSLPDSLLSSVLLDSCIVFTPLAGSPVEALSILRAKEKVQAALAEAAMCKGREAAALTAREAVPSASTIQEEAGASSSAVTVSAIREMDGEPADAADAGMAGKATCGSSPARFSPPRCGRPRGTRVTRVTLVVRKGMGENYLPDESPPL
jgi:hypothetical protein